MSEGINFNREQPHLCPDDEIAHLVDPNDQKEMPRPIPTNYSELMSDPELASQYLQVESYKVGNMVNFYDPAATENLAQQIAESGGRLAIAMHPNYFEQYRDEAEGVISRMANHTSSRVPPLLVLEQLSQLASTDQQIGGLISENSRPIYYLPTMDQVGSPMPAESSARDLVEKGLFTVSTDVFDDGGGARTLAFFEDRENRKLALEMAAQGGKELCDRLKALGIKTIIVGGANLMLYSIDWQNVSKLGDDFGGRTYMEQRKAAGAQNGVYPDECVGMLMTMLSPHFKVELSNFTRHSDRTDLEDAEAGNLS